MSFTEARGSFQVFVLDGDRLRRESVVQILRRVGYRPELFESGEQVLSAAAKSPPHIVIAHIDTEGPATEAFLQRVQARLPETRVVILCEPKTAPSAMALLKRGAYNVVVFPTITSSHFIAQIDHAVEADYYKFMSEQLEEEGVELRRQLREAETLRDAQAGEIAVRRELSQAQPLVDRQVELEAKWLKLNQWLDRLTKCSTVDECLEHLLFSLAEERRATPGLYLKYVTSFRTLVVAQSYQIERRKVRGLGIDLKRESEMTVQDALERPGDLPALRSMMKDVLGRDSFFALPLRVGSQFLGVLVLFDVETPWSQEDELRKGLTLQICSKILMQKRLHLERIRDEVTEVLDRHNFLIRIGEEVTRSRRTRLPVSLVVCSIDRFETLAARLHKEDVDLLLKMIAQILKQNSRINDVVGRISTDEFGILLPHTSRRGGAIKAERLRRIIQSADFSEAVTQAPRLTMSLGVSEYPSLSSDADDLLRTSDDALFEVRKDGENRVCLASAPRTFSPDFPVKEDG
jgi:diguanylate cyclase (GGDEF)-like protein